MRRPFHVCVFCGSRTGDAPVHLESARALGPRIGERGLALVFGGARLGLMGALADAALSAGAPVLGVLPRALSSVEVAHPGLTELVLVDGLHARKARMTAESDAFVALPGGFGTLDELKSRNQILDEACAKIGRDPKTISRSIYGWATIMPYDPWASLEAFYDVVAKYREVGINEFIIDYPPDSQLDVMERVAAEALPKLRAENG